MRNEPLQLRDPEDAAAAAAWVARRTAAAAALDQAAARRAQIAADLTTAPAQNALAAVAAAAGAVAAAQDAVAAVESARQAAEAAADRYAATTLAQAQDALDAATTAVAAELARLLAGSATSVALTATVDGLALRERYRTATATTPPRWDTTTVPFLADAGQAPVDPQIALPVVGDPAQGALLAVLDRLEDRVDAIADLVAAESLHHLVNGNPDRAGSALDIAAAGTVPDDLDVIRTPGPATTSPTGSCCSPRPKRPGSRRHPGSRPRPTRPPRAGPPPCCPTRPPCTSPWRAPTPTRERSATGST